MLRGEIENAPAQVTQEGLTRDTMDDTLRAQGVLTFSQRKEMGRESRKCLWQEGKSIHKC